MFSWVIFEQIAIFKIFAAAIYEQRWLLRLDQDQRELIATFIS